MTQGRLCALALLSIEQETAGEVNFDEIFDVLAET